MSKRRLGMVPLFMAIVILAGAAGPGASQQISRSTTAGAAIGTYALGMTRLPSSGRDGCWLEAAPITADSIRVQILCRYPAPGHHLGVLDARLPVVGDVAVYERRESTALCRISVRFRGGRALVTQEGSDSACGFGAFVDVSGTYTRLSRRRPPFDLAPIERSAAPRSRERPLDAPAGQARSQVRPRSLVDHLVHASRVS